MKSLHLLSRTAFLLALLATVAAPADAQFGRRLRDAAARAAERATTREVERRVTETVECAFNDSACIAAAEREGNEVRITGDEGEAGGEPSAFLNFDFVPGERVLFSDDFSRDVVGDFPRRLEFGSGNMEMAEWRGERWLRGTNWPSVFSIPVPETLPERFTVEMEVVPGGAGRYLEMMFSERPEHHVAVRYFQNRLNGGIRSGSSDVAAGTTQEEVTAGTPFTLRVMVDGRYAKVYAGGTRIANMPNANLGRSNAIRIELPGDAENPGYIRNIRVAAGGRDLYDALSAGGRVATQGIYFDTGSDRIRPESAPTLEEIARMLSDHGDLRIVIEGHTDSTGDDAANLQLSERRAAAVKAKLEQDHGISADRLQARGLGETQPAASNDTPEGRQQNRRVELVRM